MTKTRKKRCPHCGFLETIKWGKQQCKQRYYCKQCTSYFTAQRKDVSHQNLFIWFERWIIEKQSISQLVKRSGYSEKKLRNLFDKQLSNYPTWLITKREKVNLMIDGTYFPNKVCLVLYCDYNLRRTIFYRLTDNEWVNEIQEDLENICSIGIKIESVTCDGSRNIIKAVKTIDKRIIIQRCLIHVQRECKTWLTKHPRSDAGKTLRSLVSCLYQIKSHDDKLYWLSQFELWQCVFNQYINAKSYSDDTPKGWYTHKMVRKSYVHIKRAIPNLFNYIDYPSIPYCTNSIESFFGHLKQNIAIHRGLSLSHYKNYIKWYLFFRDKDLEK